MSSPPWPLATLLLAAATGLTGWWVGHQATAAATHAPAAPAALAATAPVTEPTPAALPAVWPLKVPDLASLPDTPLSEAIRRGEFLVSHTHEALPDNVQAAYNCTSCHRNGGTVANAGPWVGVAGLFPMYRARTGTVVTLGDRVNDCFERSMNGTPLPLDSAPMTDILAYITWLSQGVPTGVPVEGRGFAKAEQPATPDLAHGEAVYGERCASCHGVAGQGLLAPTGEAIYPPLWGDKAFNIAAGMARLDTAAAFVRHNMPLGQGGTLTEQQAYDVAAFLTTQPRPDYANKANDWPNGGKPRDARY